MDHDNPSSIEYVCDGVFDDGSGPRRCGVPETVGDMFGSKILPDERQVSVRELARILANMDQTHTDRAMKRARIEKRAYYILTTQWIIEAYLRFEKTCFHVHHYLENIRHGHVEMYLMARSLTNTLMKDKVQLLTLEVYEPESLWTVFKLGTVQNRTRT
ncbi:unnamed protein product [Heligmosomoides polygyrus]|uniref:BRCT domain-containing protein n=1 Tax=Heligmosomoides polygyrus TaxID=6339 RepID=A0A3P8BKV4_HELPZ|nr:unnamed protein product [Heligmosomoides polygyrus]